MARRSAGLAVLCLLAACRGAPPAPVPVAGDAALLRQLAGTWEGSYQSAALGRAGSILFTLAAGEDHAHGDVVMIPRGATRPLRPVPPPGMPAMEAGQMAQVLTIRFVRVSGDSLSGVLDPYLDPDCGCPTVTTFRGRMDGGRIRGTFDADQGQGRTLAGTWEVRRR